MSVLTTFSCLSEKSTAELKMRKRIFVASFASTHKGGGLNPGKSRVGSPYKLKVRHDCGHGVGM